MGWIEIPRYFTNKSEKEAFVLSLFGKENVRHINRDGTVYYLAIQQGEEVKAYVVQTYQKYIYSSHGKHIRAFGYRVDCETVCPTHHDTSRALIEELTPTVNAYAIKWRSLCRRTQNNRRLLRVAPIGTKLHIVDKISGDITLIWDRGQRFWVNDAHTLVYPISLLARQELVFDYTHLTNRRH